jgi:hypothetical protein
MKNTTITMTGKLPRTTPWALALPLSALVALHGGCAGEALNDPGDDPGDQDPGDDPDGDGDPDQPLDATGMYQIDSRFDLISGMPGTVGEVANTFVEMTDDPYDPASWLIDTVLASWDGGIAEDLIEGARPGLDALLHEKLMERAPDLVNQLVEVGDRFGQVAREFGINSTLEVVGDSGDGLSATHTAMGYHFAINGTEHAYTLDELERDPVAIEGIGVEFDGTSLRLSEHSVPLQYGGFLAMVLDDVIIPQVHAGAHDLGDLLQSLVDCDAVGQSIYDELDFGSPGVYAGLCTMGLETGAGFVMNKLVSIDEEAQVKLIIAGSAHAADQSGDRRIDTLSSGAWTGAIDYAGSMGTLLEDANTFTGQRM